MALLHRARLTPSKLELLDVWLPRQPWSPKVTGVQQVGAYRFDDPAGEVGMEAFLLRDDEGSLWHVPVTYRAEARPRAEGHLVGTTEHSVLGRRWVYDACGDPVWATALATAVLTGGTQAEEAFEVDGRLEAREPSMTVSGSGSAGADVAAISSVEQRDEQGTTVITTGPYELVVVRRVGLEVPCADTLTGRWDGGSGTLAGLTPR